MPLLLVPESAEILPTGFRNQQPLESLFSLALKRARPELKETPLVAAAERLKECARYGPLISVGGRSAFLVGFVCGAARRKTGHFASVRGLRRRLAWAGGSVPVDYLTQARSLSGAAAQLETANWPGAKLEDVIARQVGF